MLLHSAVFLRAGPGGSLAEGGSSTIICCLYLEAPGEPQTVNFKFKTNATGPLVQNIDASCLSVVDNGIGLTIQDKKSHFTFPDISSILQMRGFLSVSGSGLVPPFSILVDSVVYDVNSTITQVPISKGTNIYNLIMLPALVDLIPFNRSIQIISSTGSKSSPWNVKVKGLLDNTNLKRNGTSIEVPALGINKNSSVSISCNGVATQVTNYTVFFNPAEQMPQKLSFPLDQNCDASSIFLSVENNGSYLGALKKDERSPNGIFIELSPSINLAQTPISTSLIHLSGSFFLSVLKKGESNSNYSIIIKSPDSLCSNMKVISGTEMTCTSSLPPHAITKDTKIELFDKDNKTISSSPLTYLPPALSKVTKDNNGKDWLITIQDLTYNSTIDSVIVCNKTIDDTEVIDDALKVSIPPSLPAVSNITAHEGNVTIGGLHFGSDSTVTKVHINDTLCNITSITNNEIVCQLPNAPPSMTSFPSTRLLNVIVTINDIVGTSTTYIEYDRKGSNLWCGGHSCKMSVSQNVNPEEICKKLDVVIAPGLLPQSIKHISFECQKIKLEANTLPSSLDSLVLGFDYNHQLEQDTLPKSLKSIRFGSFYNHPIAHNTLPIGLTHLSFVCDSIYTLFDTNGCFNHPIEPGVLPPTLTHLEFGMDYDQPLQPGSLPSSLLSLSFGEFYNHSLSNVLPSSLETLELGSNYNIPLDYGDLPASLKSLSFGINFNHSIDHVLPVGLTSLKLGFRFMCELGSNALPETLKYLEVSSNYKLPLPVLPASLVHLKAAPNVILSSPPPNLTHYTIRNNPLKPLTPSSIPTTVTHLTLYGYNHPIASNSLPPCLQSLVFRDGFHQPLQVDSLPNTLIHLDLDDTYNLELQPSVLPDSLTSLCVKISSPTKVFKDLTSLPPRLQHLQVYGDSSIPRSLLPPTVTSLSFKDNRFAFDIPQITNLEFNDGRYQVRPVDDIYLLVSAKDQSFFRFIRKTKLTDFFILDGFRPSQGYGKDDDE
eukprot:gene13333-15680_t